MIVCDGSGRASDLIAFAHRHVLENELVLNNLSFGLVLAASRQNMLFISQQKIFSNFYFDGLVNRIEPGVSFMKKN